MQPRPREVSPAPSGSSDQELNPPLPSPVSLSAHDQLPLFSTPSPFRATLPSSPPSHPIEHSMFNRAHDFIIKDVRFTDNSQTSHAISPGPFGLGLEILLKKSMPDAFHDSLARHPPPRCHLGTRKEYINLIIQWALGESDHKEPVLWLRGPFGVGKTAVAQTSAEALKSLDKLLATLFFFRLNADRNDPRRVFPSIVWQIASLYSSFAEIIDMILQKDPSITTKPLSTQFEELIIIPLQQIDVAAKVVLEGRVVIIDGLDECQGTAEQCEIIRIIAASARNRTTPFRWFITSRPEDPIIRTMNSFSVSPIVYMLELPVSRKIDHEILLYLVDEFAKIRESHGLPDSWPSEEVLTLLVDHTDGLWIYISTMVRFVKDDISLGPVDQLHIILKFLGDVSNKVAPNNPLEEMDFLYVLILQRIPSDILTTIQKILLLHSLNSSMNMIAQTLGLSVPQLHRYCASLQSVMELRGNDLRSLKLHFYHASFVHFLTNANDHPIDVPTAAAISNLPFQKMLRLVPEGSHCAVIDENTLNQNLPLEFRDRIIRKGECPIPGCTKTHPIFIFGFADNEAFGHLDKEFGHLDLAFAHSDIALPASSSSSFLVSHEAAGLEMLLSHSMPDAFHDSLARHPPPKCHPGTQKEYIDRIIQWALGESDHEKPVLWLHGRSSSPRFSFPVQTQIADDPRRVFPSIICQIASLCQSFADIILRKYPSITTKSLSTQFEELIVAPLRQIDAVDSGLEGRVVIIDGLDECGGTAEQCEMIRIIAASARDRTTPFRWLITSRPEDPIVQTMKSPIISSVVSRIELLVSRAIDREILLFLTDEFAKIRESHGLRDSWPSEGVLTLLVEHGHGLWIYVSTMVRFVKDVNPLGPEDQLRILLELINDVSDKDGSRNPLAEMDLLYSLIMQRIPSDTRTICRSIVLLHSLDNSVDIILHILGLSAEQFRRYCLSLQSVMELQGYELDSLTLHFYHASFVDFLIKPSRSREFCIYGEFLIQYRKQLLEWLHFVCSRSSGSAESPLLVLPVSTPLPKEIEGDRHYAHVTSIFWKLCCTHHHPIDTPTATSISTLPFQKMLRLIPEDTHCAINEDALNHNLPAVFRGKIIRRAECPIPGCRKTHPAYIFGHGDNEAFAHIDPFEHIATGNDQNNAGERLGRESKMGDRRSREQSPSEQEVEESEHQEREHELRTSQRELGGRGLTNIRSRGHSEQTKIPLVREEEEESVHEDRVQSEVAHNEDEQLQMLWDDLETEVVEGLPPPLEDASHERASGVECIPGTRTQYIEDFVAWSTDSDHQQDHLFWLQGPAGAGKTTVARSCAYRAAELGTLGASFFFSCENDVVDSARFFITIAHQLASRIPRYKIALRQKLRADPTISTARDLGQQFQKLIIQPFLDASGKQGLPVETRTIVVDGLDDCDDVPAQSTILKLVMESIKTYSVAQVPLVWAFFSRPEAHIISEFSRESISTICKLVQLKVSHDLDDEIRDYLYGKLEVSDDPSASWGLSEVDIDILVRMAAGFYFYAAEMVKYMLSPDAGGPKEQLQKAISATSDTCVPLAKLDSLYRGILARVPNESLPAVQQILLLHYDSRGALSTGFLPTRYLAILSGLDLASLELYLSPLASLLTLEVTPLDRDERGLAIIVPVHASFVFFLGDKSRSKECMNHERNWCAIALRGLTLLDGLNKIKDVPYDARLGELQKLLHIPSDQLNTLSHYLYCQDELYDYLRMNVVRWCAQSGLSNDSSEALQVLRTSGLKILQKAGVEVDPGLLSQLPEETRLVLSNIRRIRHHPTLEQAQNLQNVLDPTADEAETRQYFASVSIDETFKAVTEGTAPFNFLGILQILTVLKRERDNPGTMDIVDLLEVYVDQWKKYEAVISSLFWNHRTLAKEAFLLWQTEFYMPLQSAELGLTHATLHLINQHRRGELVGDYPRQFIKSLLQMRDSFDPAPLPDSDVYFTHFEAKFLESTKEYYAMDPTLHSDNRVDSKLKHVKRYLIKERTLLIALDLPLSERQRCMQECSRILLDSWLGAIYTEFKRLLDLELDLDVVESLRRICLVTYWLSDATQELDSIFKAQDKVSRPTSASVIEALDKIIRDHPEWDRSAYTLVAPGA
ncbi:hypothetical protein NP233_g11228 [Leucocoprinus birnbaumii]|uniref:NACHT domain-containing protein n=1 Tax=Leucocoprinus birnbaumii TaxID=56174 RepID=A0AAD5VGY0_9AGAR|nr:hypothetical protein NP233_g11228 [Leucocoprinus birnbaumii]